ncbi:MAG: pyrroline-5-carboxylate reductase [Oscillospiraceae bacterium]|nr:pyrroline-5-carboxylate reductase [Oscillospiraceae bacterium]
MFERIGLIGCGNMGSAVLRACGGRGALYCSNRSREKAEALAAELGGKVCDNAAIASGCSLIFLGVKPQMMDEVLQALRPVFASRRDRFVLVSMAAALSCESLQSMAGGAYPVIRMMPNTPVAVGAGVVQFCHRDCTEEEISAFCCLMEQAGMLDPVEEKQIDAAAALSGCGPAFLCLVMEALADGGVACGLPRDKAQRYAAQTLIGTGKLALTSGEHPGTLKDRVCSPGGTTIQGVLALEQHGVRAAFFEAVQSAYEKTLALQGEEYSK